MIEPFDVVAGRVKALWVAGGLKRGSSTGWPSVDELYSVSLGQWTLISGWPGSGKSEWLDALLVNLAKREPWRFVIYSPENWPLELHFSKILEKYLGKPFTPGPTPRMDEEELDDALAWMKGKFHFAKPDKPTMAEILGEAGQAKSYGHFKTGVIIDPWNQLEHYRPANMSETEYVSATLSMVIAWVRDMNCHLWLVAHPSKLQRTREGKLPIPTPHDVSGSAHFWNKTDNAITVWRDQVEGSQEVQIHVQKVRFKSTGRVGLATLRYDRVTGKYNEQPPRIAAGRPYAD